MSCQLNPNRQVLTNDASLSDSVVFLSAEDEPTIEVLKVSQQVHASHLSKSQAHIKCNFERNMDREDNWGRKKTFPGRVPLVGGTTEISNSFSSVYDG